MLEVLRTLFYWMLDWGSFSMYSLLDMLDLCTLKGYFHAPMYTPCVLGLFLFYFIFLFFINKIVIYQTHTPSSIYLLQQFNVSRYSFTVST